MRGHPHGQYLHFLSGNQVKAHLDFARVTAERYAALLKVDAVSPREVDEKRGVYEACSADYAAAEGSQPAPSRATETVPARYGAVVKSADRAEVLATARYKAGLVNVLELVDAQRTRLQAERVRLLVRQQQMLASVTLIRALGGGWAERRDASGTAWVMPAKQTPGSEHRGSISSGSRAA